MLMQASPRHYLPPLDGLRFLAFFLVFLSHLPGNPGSPLLGSLKSHSGLGVEFFFIISAFLFTTLLNIEWRRQGRIDFRHFYLRRILRIAPLYYVYILLIWVLSGNDLPTGPQFTLHLIGVLTFTDNLVEAWQGLNPYGPFHLLWTISFEMQLYLAIPFICCVLNPRPMGERLRLCAYVEIIALLLRYQVLGENNLAVWMIHIRRPDSILIGILLAYFHLEHPQPLSRAMRWAGLTIWLAGAALVTMSIADSPVGIAPVDFRLLYLIPGAAITFGGLLFITIRSHGIAGWLASCPPVRYLGKISYGLYVYHLFCLQRVADTMPWVPEGLHTATALVMTILTASVSYYIVERPFLRIKERYAFVPSRPV